MQNKKEFTASFKKLFKIDAKMRDKEVFARWFTQLDLSDGRVFDSEDEQKEIERKMKSNFKAHFNPQISHSPSKRFLNQYSWVLGTAATVFLIGILAYVFFVSTQSVHKPLVFAKLEKKSAPGVLTKIDLPDGSEIWLNAGSTITYPAQFDTDVREVKLEGEAYFNIQHDQKRPFLIHSATMVTQVLGTSFNISSYPDNQQIKVTVLSGKVAVYERGANGKAVSGKVHFVEANQEVMYQKHSHQFFTVKKEIKSIDAAAWKEGNLIFKSTELSEVIQRLERHYGTTIQTDVVLDCPVTVNFNKEPLDRVMRVLAQLVNGQLEYKDGQYHLTGILCQ
jgi:transmembrane sensor